MMGWASSAALRSVAVRPALVPVVKAIEVLPGVLSFALLTWAGARISFPLPFTPVPGSLQTLVVLLSGALLGAGAGAASQSAYLLMGMSGLPVFALPGSGPAYFLGPTAGYLLGFIACAYVTGSVLRRCRGLGVPGVLLSFGAGSAILYLCGVSWLTVYMAGDFGRAFKAGVAPFVLFDLAKMVMAAGIYLGWGRFRRAVTGWRSASIR